MQRLGVIGGTFDPIHTGHLLLAQFVYERLSLTTVLFVVAADPPHKDHRVDIVCADDRWAMLELAIEGVDHFEGCRVEMERPGKSYTVDTLKQLRALNPSADLFLIVGADNVADMATWHDPAGILELCTVVAGSRVTGDRAADPDLAEQMLFVETPVVEVSSTDIRRRLRDGLSVRWLVPDRVAEYIHSKGLYRQ